jgi:hypothetical protein
MVKEYEEKRIYDGLIECMNNFSEEHKNNIFKKEGYFHLRLYKNLKNYFKKDPSIHIILEYYALNYDLSNNDIKDIIKDYEAEDENAVILKSDKIDIVILVDNRHYLIELKCSIYNNKEYYGGTKKDDVIEAYENDIKKINNLVKKNNSAVCGYCILLTTCNIDNNCRSPCKNLKAKEETNGAYTYYIKEVKQIN